MNTGLTRYESFIRTFIGLPLTGIIVVWSIFMIENAGVMLVNNLIFKHQALTPYSEISKPLDKKIQNVIWEFKAEAENYGIKVDFKNLTFSSGWVSEDSVGDRHTVAACRSMFNHIYFDDVTYSPAQPRAFKSVMYHELAHCLFDLEHDETELGFPNLMNALDTTYWDELSDETWVKSKEHLFKTILKSQS